jgi:hypothetical protein
MPAKGAKYTGTRIPANKLAGLGNIDQHTINVGGSGLEIRERIMSEFFISVWSTVNIKPIMEF